MTPFRLPNHRSLGWSPRPILIAVIGFVLPSIGLVGTPCAVRSAGSSAPPVDRAVHSLERYNTALGTTLDSVENGISEGTRRRIDDLRASAESLVKSVRETSDDAGDRAYQTRLVEARNRLQAHQAAVQQDLLKLKLRAMNGEGRAKQPSRNERSDFEKIMGILLDKREEEETSTPEPTPQLGPETYDSAVDRIDRLLRWLVDQARYAGELRATEDPQQQFELGVRRTHRHFILYLEAYFQDRDLTPLHAENYREAVEAYSVQLDRGELSDRDRQILFPILKLQSRMLDPLSAEKSERYRRMTEAIWRLLSQLRGAETRE